MLPAMRRRAVAVVVGLGIATGARAGTPFITDDPGSPRRGWEINLGLAYGRSRAESRLAAPTLDLNYSVDPHIQLNANVGGVSVFGVRDAASTTDTQLKMKWRVVDDQTDAGGTDADPRASQFAGPGVPMFDILAGIAATGPLAISVAPTLILPTGDVDRGLGGGAYLFRLPVQIGKTLGDWYVYGEVGYQFGVARTDAGRRVGGPITAAGDALFFGAAVEYTVSPSVSVGAEINGQRVLDATGGYSLNANVGGTVSLGEGWALLGTIGRTLREDSRGGPQVLVQVFLQVVF